MPCVLILLERKSATGALCGRQPPASNDRFARPERSFVVATLADWVCPQADIAKIPPQDFGQAISLYERGTGDQRGADTEVLPLDSDGTHRVDADKLVVLDVEDIDRAVLSVAHDQVALAGIAAEI